MTSDSSSRKRVLNTSKIIRETPKVESPDVFACHGNDPQDVRRAIRCRAPDSAAGGMRNEFDADLLLALVRTSRTAIGVRDRSSSRTLLLFAGANGKIVLCGDIRLFGSELHGGFEPPTPRAATALPEVREILTQIGGSLRDSPAET